VNHKRIRPVPLPWSRCGTRAVMASASGDLTVLGEQPAVLGGHPARRSPSGRSSLAPTPTSSLHGWKTAAWTPASWNRTCTLRPVLWLRPASGVTPTSGRRKFTFPSSFPMVADLHNLVVRVTAEVHELAQLPAERRLRLIVDVQLAEQQYAMWAHRSISARALSPSPVSYWSPARTDVMRCVLKPSQCIRPT
jgi:hypothetical protein